jgi:undecaprenyl-diphosphatase
VTEPASDVSAIPESVVAPPTMGDRLHRRASGFDLAVDRAFGRLRGNPNLDRFFYEASSLGDFSLLWQLLGAVQALTASDPLVALARSTTILGVESVAVNQGVKRLFDRERPIHDGERPHELRRPRTSSFPSGHASAAFTAAVVLSEGRRGKPLFYAAAAVVASSRVYVRIHHASDVVAGAAVGYAFGRLAVRLWRRA